MSKIGSLLGFALGTTRRFVGRIALFVIGSVVLNIVLFILLPTRCPLSSGVGFAQIFAECSMSVLIGALFLVGFPIIYALLGYKNAIQNTLHYAYTQNKDVFFEYITDKFLGKINMGSKAAAGIVNVADFSKRFFDKLDNLPFVFRAIVGVLKKIIPFAEIVTKVAQQNDLETGNRQLIAGNIAREADTYLKTDLLQPDWTLPGVLFVINMGVFALLKFL